MPRLALNPMRRLLVRLIAPDALRHLNDAQAQLAELQATADWLDGRLRSTAHQASGLRRHLAELAVERDLCLDNLMALVALDDAGHWTTVFDADTRLPSEIASYLGELVARA